jgi:hypothetical protein
MEKKELIEKLIELIKENLTGLMEGYSYNPNGSDYKCQFCHEMAINNRDLVIHKNCDGQKINDLINQIKNME